MPRRELKTPAPVSIKYSSALLEKLESCRPAGKIIRPCPLTSEQQAALVQFWPVKNHGDLCEVLGVTKNTALSWYRKLTQKKDEIT
jgi:hypothetical protein